MRALGVAAAMLAAGAAHAQMEVGEAEFIYSSELMASGFEPFATSGVGQAIYGLQRGNALYLCFLADQPELQAARQETIVAQIEGTAEARIVPNVPVVCVLTQ